MAGTKSDENGDIDQRSLIPERQLSVEEQKPTNEVSELYT